MAICVSPDIQVSFTSIDFAAGCTFLTGSQAPEAQIWLCRASGIQLDPTQRRWESAAGFFFLTMGPTADGGNG